jgi:hypothetical protein
VRWNPPPQHTFVLNISLMKNRYLVSLASVLALCIFSCSREEIKPLSGANNFSQKSDRNRVEGMERRPIVLGKRLINPYTFQNIKDAATELGTQINLAAFNVNIRVNYKYVKLLPKNWEEYDQLKIDTSLMLFDYPLEYELSQGDYYHEVGVPDTLPTPQYSVVPVDYGPPAGIAMQVIDDLYLSEKDKGVSPEWLASDDYAKLETQSSVRTGNADTTGTDGQRVAFLRIPKRYHPEGNVYVMFDNGSNPTFRPVERQQIRARRIALIYTTYTNQDGYFQFGDFRYPVSYSSYYESADHDVRSGNFGQAYYNGPHQREPWYHRVYAGAHNNYTMVNQAAVDVYTIRNWGIEKPRKTRIGVFSTGASLGHYNGGIQTFGGGLIVPSIKIYANSRPSIDVYQTSVHEFGHASHHKMGSDDYNDTETKVKETWAEGFRQAYTTARYGQAGDRPTANNGNRAYNDQFQYRKYDNESNRFENGEYKDRTYTSVVVDLQDNTNQWYFGGIGFQYDNVSNISLSNIQSALRGKKNWYQWRQSLRSQNPNQSNEIFNLFNYWN